MLLVFMENTVSSHANNIIRDFKWQSQKINNLKANI